MGYPSLTVLSDIGQQLASRTHTVIRLSSAFLPQMMLFYRYFLKFASLAVRMD